MKYCPLCDKTYPDTAAVCEIDGAVLQESRSRQDSLTGTIIKGRYRINKRLGDGGMGTVYLAEQVAISRQVALKILHPDYARDHEFVRRFRQEARLAASLNHRHVITVYDFDQTDDGSLYIVMEYVDGLSLSRLIHDGPMEVNRAVNLARQIAEGLNAAHRAGVIHRDVKPDNIMVAGGDEIKLMDFGIARLRDTGAASRLTRLGTIMGTPAYMAPEQIEGGDVSEKTDIYAFGVVLHEMLSGAAPFQASTPAAVLMKHLQEAPTPLRKIRGEIPLPLERIVSQALEKNPEKRQQDLTGVIDAFRRLQYSDQDTRTSTASAITRPLVGIFQALLAFPARTWRIAREVCRSVLVGTGKDTRRETNRKSRDEQELAATANEQIAPPETTVSSTSQPLARSSTAPLEATVSAELIDSTRPAPPEKQVELMTQQHPQAEPVVETEQPSLQAEAKTAASIPALEAESFTDTIPRRSLENRAPETELFNPPEEVIEQKPTEVVNTEVISAASSAVDLATDLPPHQPPAKDIRESTQAISEESAVLPATTAVIPAAGGDAEPSVQMKESAGDLAVDQITRRTEATETVATGSPETQAISPADILPQPTIAAPSYAEYEATQSATRLDDQVQATKLLPTDAPQTSIFAAHSAVDATAPSTSTIAIEKPDRANRRSLGIGFAAIAFGGVVVSVGYFILHQPTPTFDLARQAPIEVDGPGKSVRGPVKEPDNKPESKAEVLPTEKKVTAAESPKAPDQSPPAAKPAGASETAPKSKPVQTTQPPAAVFRQPQTSTPTSARVVTPKQGETKPTKEKSEQVPSIQAGTAEKIEPAVKDTSTEIASIGKPPPKPLGNDTAPVKGARLQPTPAPTAPPVRNELVSLAVRASKREFNVKDRLMLSVKGRYSDGKEQEVLGGVRWDTSDSNVAIVNSRGELEARGEGKAQISAKYLGVTSSAITVFVKDREKVTEAEKKEQGIKDIRRGFVR